MMTSLSKLPAIAELHMTAELVQKNLVIGAKQHLSNRTPSTNVPSVSDAP